MFNIVETISENLEKTLYGSPSHKLTGDKSVEFWHDYYLAGEATTSAEKLATLSEHIDPIIRKRVAENLHIPAFVQQLLVNDNNIDVRLALTANPSTLVETWQELAKDESELVRFFVASNKNIPVPMLVNLTRDKQANIATQAQQTIDTIFDTMRLAAA